MYFYGDIRRRRGAEYQTGKMYHIPILSTFYPFGGSMQLYIPATVLSLFARLVGDQYTYISTIMSYHAAKEAGGIPVAPMTNVPISEPIPKTGVKAFDRGQSAH